MTLEFEETLLQAARLAEEAVKAAMSEYASGHLTDEDDITPSLAGHLSARLKGRVGNLDWSTSVVRHRRGKAAEEKRIGADLIIHIKFDTHSFKYSKGVLVQAKKSNKNEFISKKEHDRLRDQCKTMMHISPSSFVFNYQHGAMRCGPASRFEGSTSRNLDENCVWTSYRFFRELFRCPIGDPRINSSLVKDLFIPIEINIVAIEIE